MQKRTRHRPSFFDPEPVTGSAFRAAVAEVGWQSASRLTAEEMRTAKRRRIDREAATPQVLPFCLPPKVRNPKLVDTAAQPHADCPVQCSYHGSVRPSTYNNRIFSTFRATDDNGLQAIDACCVDMCSEFTGVLLPLPHVSGSPCSPCSSPLVDWGFRAWAAGWLRGSRAWT